MSDKKKTLPPKKVAEEQPESDDEEVVVEKKTEEEEKEDITLGNPDVVTKYNAAGEIATRVLKKVADAAVVGAKVIDLCILGDKSITEALSTVFNNNKKLTKGVAFPTCVSVNNCVCNFNPILSDPNAADAIKDGDVVKIELAVHIDGFVANAATTVVVGTTKESPATGRKADVILAAHYAAEAAMRVIKAGKKNTEVTSTVQAVADAFKTKPIEGSISTQISKNVISGEKQIVLNPTDSQRREIKEVEFAEGEVYAVEITVSSGDGKAKAVDTRTTVFKKTDTTYSLKMKTSRAVLSEISSKFGKFAFPLRAMEDERKARMGIVECASHGLVTPYEVIYEKEGEFVAQFAFTVLLLPAGPLVITKTGFDTAFAKSEHAIQDEALKALIAAPIRPKKKSNKKKAAAADAKEEEN